MLILNACKDVKVSFSDGEELLLFSPRILSKTDSFELCLSNGILLDKKVDHFISGFNHSVIMSEDKKQIYAIKVDAAEDICKTFLGELLTVDGKVFLQDEECAF